jgi:hypothetical protein
VLKPSQEGSLITGPARPCKSRADFWFPSRPVRPARQGLKAVITYSSLIRSNKNQCRTCLTKINAYRSMLKVTNSLYSKKPCMSLQSVLLSVPARHSLERYTCTFLVLPPAPVIPPASYILIVLVCWRMSNSYKPILGVGWLQTANI